MRTLKKVKDKSIPLISYFKKDSLIVEQMRSIQASLNYLINKDAIQTILFTSPEADEGKSTVISNLAVLYAEKGLKVLLVDADLRNPSIHTPFRIPNRGGLSNWLKGELVSFEQTIQPTAIENLSIVVAGDSIHDPANLLDSEKMKDFLQRTKEAFDVVFIDTTPLTAVSDAQILSAKIDGTIIIVRENITKKKALEKAMTLIQLSGSPLLGIIYNGARKSVYSGYY